MRAARVIGSVVACRAAPGLEGRRLLLLQPVTADREDTGSPFVACDAVNAGPGSWVFWIGAREAALALPQPDVPVDATCIALWETPASEGGRV